MKFERIFIAAAALALIVAIPITVALQKVAAKYDAEHQKSVHLHFNIDSLQKQVDQNKAKSDQLKKTNDDLQKQLQAKKEAATKLAVAKIAPVPTVVAPAGCEQYVNTVSQYQWDTRTAMAIMQAENHSCAATSTSPMNTDGTIDRGLFQVNSIHTDLVAGDLSKLYDPTTNIKVAYEIYKGGGWSAWTTYKTGKYLAYLR